MSTKKSKSQLYRENLDLKAQLKNANDDREEFRTYFRNEIKTQLSNVSEKCHTSPENAIKRMVQVFNKVRPFHIWW